ncbi:hypothetical protein HKD37_05G013499 [Glycine soja]
MANHSHHIQQVEDIQRRREDGMSGAMANGDIFDIGSISGSALFVIHLLQSCDKLALSLSPMMYLQSDGFYVSLISVSLIFLSPEGQTLKTVCTHQDRNGVQIVGFSFCGD